MSGDGIPVSKSFGLSHNHGNFPGKGERSKMSEYKSEHFEGDGLHQSLLSWLGFAILISRTVVK